MNANYAEICRAGNLEEDFNKFHLINFCEIFPILLWNINYSNSAKKNKKYFLRQKFQKITLLQKLHRSDQFLAITLILAYVVQNTTQK